MGIELKTRRLETSEILRNPEKSPVIGIRVLRAVNSFFGVALLFYLALIVYFLAFGGFDFHFADIRVKMSTMEKPAAIVVSLAFIYAITLPGWPIYKVILKSARKLTIPVLIMFALGLGVRLAYLSYTDFNTRTHDVIGHIQYIDHIVVNNSLPDRGECWQCYHPPLYYGLTAGVYHLLSALGVERDNMWVKLQLCSVLLYMIFLYYAVLLVKRYVRSRYFFIMGAALLIFWPVGVMHSVRIGNDALLYPVYAAGLYYLALWHEEGRTRDLYISTVLGATTLAIKTNGIVLLGVIGVMVLHRLFTDSNRKAVLKHMAVMALIVTIGTTAGFYRTVSEKLMGKGENWLVGNVHKLAPEIYVGNEPGNYLYFDIPTFIREPFTSPWDDKYGRQYFFNFLLKTGLFTENQINLKINRATASIMSVLLLVFIAYSIAYTLSMDRNRPGELNIILLNMALLLTAAVLFRITIPAATSSDFRYILPIMISLVVLVVKSVERLRAEGYTTLEYVGHASVWTFIFSSIVFLINPTISSQ